MASSSAAVQRSVQWLQRHGIKPVPIRLNSKAAVTQGYEKDGWEPPELVYWQKGNYGVGAKTGPKENGPIDGDLDCDEATFFAPRFLPVTEAMFGRLSKLDSHLFYMSTQAEFAGAKFIDPVTRSMIMELRGDGGNQTVCPGSIHEGTGEEITFSKDFGKDGPNIADADPDDLVAGAKKVSACTLIARHMWADGSRNDVCLCLAGIFFYLEWDVDEAWKMVEAVMEYLGDDDKTRRISFYNTFKKGERGMKIAGSGKLREILGDAKLVDRFLQWTGSQTSGFLADYNERYSVVSIEGKFRVADTAVPPGQAPVFMGREDFTFIKENDFFTTDEGKRIPKAKVWLASPMRRTYNTVDFLPGKDDTGATLNLWTGWPIRPVEGSCEAWKRLVREIVCGGDKVLFDWIINWMAGILQQPMNKAGTSLVVIGIQGAGKTVFVDYFGDLLGGYYMPISNDEQIFGRFNSHLGTTLLIHSEEALYVGDKKHRGIIKSLITDPYRIYEPKNVNAKRVRNFVRLILTSNNDNAAPVEANDRRYTVAKVGDRKASDELVKSVMKEREEGGPAALMHYLMNEVKFDFDKARKNLRNQDYVEARKMNYDPQEQWWSETLNCGELLPDILAWGQYPRGADGGSAWPKVLSSSALHASYLLWCQKNNLRNAMTEQVLAVYIDRMIGVRLERNGFRPGYVNPWAGENSVPQFVRLLSERPRSISNMPPLDKCREAFAKHVGHDIEWPEEVTETKQHGRHPIAGTGVVTPIKK